MNKLSAYISVFIPSLGCLFAIAWLGNRSAMAGNHERAHLYVILFLCGGIVVPAAFTFLINQISRSEGERWALSHRKASPQARIRKQKEQQLSQIKFFKHHPGVVFLFCTLALIFSIVMTLAPKWAPDNDQNATVLHWFGIVVGLAYVLRMLPFFYAILTKRWHPYMDSRIRKLEARIAQCEVKSGN